MTVPFDKTLEQQYYAQLYSIADIDRDGRISGGEAVAFLRTSGLTDAALEIIWDLADHSKCGHLTHKEFAYAMRLVSLAQSGKPISLEQIHNVTALPRFSTIPYPQASTQAPQNNYSSSNTSQQTHNPNPNPTISISIQQQQQQQLPQQPSSFNNRNQNISSLSTSPIPQSQYISTSPTSHQQYIPQNTNTSIIQQPQQVQQQQNQPQNVNTNTNTNTNANANVNSNQIQNNSNSHNEPPTIVNSLQYPQKFTDQEIFKFDNLFVQADVNKDGFVDGNEAKAYFSKGNLSSQQLANVWTLCEMDKDGKLSLGEFRLAMHLIYWIMKSQTIPLTFPPTLIAQAFSVPSQTVTQTVTQTQTQTQAQSQPQGQKTNQQSNLEFAPQTQINYDQSKHIAQYALPGASFETRANLSAELNNAINKRKQ